PFQNTGQMSITSCWCAAPTQGSLARNMSPSRIPGLSLRYSSAHFTWVSVTPDMYCMYGPKYTNSPSSVRIEGLRSSAYIATGDPDRRWIVAPCSSFTCHKLWRITSYVIGSIFFALFLCSLSFGDMESFFGGT